MVTKKDAASAAADPVPGNNGEALDRIVAYFAETFPAEWENIRLCPTQHGLEEMAKLLA